jgi:hypothetical protein
MNKVNGGQRLLDKRKRMGLLTFHLWREVILLAGVIGAALGLGYSFSKTILG